MPKLSIYLTASQHTALGLYGENPSNAIQNLIDARLIILSRTHAQAGTTYVECPCQYCAAHRMIDTLQREIITLQEIDR